MAISGEERGVVLFCLSFTVNGTSTYCCRATQLCESSIIVPGKVALKAVLISSPALRAQSCVLGTIPTLGFEVAPVINHYQVTHFVDVDLSAYPLQLLSLEVKLMEVDLIAITKEPLKVGLGMVCLFQGETFS